MNVCDPKYEWLLYYLNENIYGIMTEPKKVAFSTLGSMKKEKKRERKVKSWRIALTLAESNEKSCPEFNYRELLAQRLVSTIGKPKRVDFVA